MSYALVVHCLMVTAARFIFYIHCNILLLFSLCASLNSCFCSFQIKKALCGLKVEVTHRGNMRRKYRVCGLTSQATGDLTWVTRRIVFDLNKLIFSFLIDWVLSIFNFRFPVDERGTLKSVVDYFYKSYGYEIQHPHLPCLQVGNTQKPNYLPMEVNKQSNKFIISRW